MAATLLVRADANAKTGIGHLTRTFALAEAWRATGGQVGYISCCPAEKLRRRIESSGAELTRLAQIHPDPSDRTRTLAAAAEWQRQHDPATRPWFVLDGYHFDPAYQQAIRQAGWRLLVVDDQAKLPEYYADVLLNQNLGAGRHVYPCSPATVQLLGPRFALLRPEFQRWQSLARRTPQVARKVLVTLGGSDPEGVTPLVVEALGRVAVPGLEVRVVVGPATPPGGRLEESVEAARHSPTVESIRVLSDPGDMAELMAWADLAVSAAGSTCWELAWMQLPAAVVVVADNQQPIADGLDQAGAVCNLGRAADLSVEAVAETVEGLLQDAGRRAAQSAAGRTVIDGRGAQRVVAIMQALDGPLQEAKLVLRPLQPDDLMPVWRLANEPEVRRFSLLSSDPIPLEDHVLWFAAKLTSNDSCIWALEYEGLLLGTARYDRTDDQAALIAYSIHPAFRRRGLGTMILRQTLSQAAEQLGVSLIRGQVRDENVPSARALAKVGLEHVCSEDVNGHSCKVFERRMES